MPLIDSLVSIFNPEAAYRRMHFRDALADAKRDYAAAKGGRRNGNWSATGASANTEARFAFAILRERARAFVRNGWAGQRILDVSVSHAIGTGIMTVPNTGSDRADNRYRLAREQWEEASDVEGVLDYGGQQALLFRSMLEGGDAVTRFIRKEFTSTSDPVPFRLQLLEGDHIDVSCDHLGGDVRLGVQLGDWGERLGLWLLKVHPGEMAVSTQITSDLVTWDNLCHLYRPLRIGQLRGITAFAPVLLPAQELQDLMEAAILQQRTQASFSGFIRRPPGASNPLVTKKDDKGQTVTSIQPGQIQDIGESEITFPQGSSQSVFGDANMAGLLAMAAGAGITYDQLTGDLRQANYSSLRAGKIEFRRLIEQLQWQTIVPMLIRPVDRAFELYATMAGHLPSRRGGWNVDHVMPAVEPIDPKKDLEADILAVRSGRMSPQEFISAWGRDWRKVVTDFEAFFSFIDQNNVVLEIDPRRSAVGASAVDAPMPDKTGA